LSASLGFAVSAGQTYRVRVSGVNAKPESNFIGSLSFYCDGSTNPADVNADGVVGLGDLAIVLTDWGPQPNGHPADIDNNGIVGSPDLAQVLGAWSP
jgi:hypothetical protein